VGSVGNVEYVACHDGSAVNAVVHIVFSVVGHELAVFFSHGNFGVGGMAKDGDFTILIGPANARDRYRVDAEDPGPYQLDALLLPQAVVSIGAGEETAAALFVADNPSTAKHPAELRIQIESEADLRLSLNGTAIPLTRTPRLEQEFGLVWFTAPLPKGTVVQGRNVLRVQLNDSAEKTTRLTGVEVRLCYA